MILKSSEYYQFQNGYIVLFVYSYIACVIRLILLHEIYSYLLPLQSYSLSWLHRIFCILIFYKIYIVDIVVDIHNRKETFKYYQNIIDIRSLSFREMNL